MKKSLSLLTTAALAVSLSTGCAVMSHVPGLNLIYSGPTTKNTKVVDKAQAKTDQKQAQLEAYQKELSTRVSSLESNKVLQGSAFVYGTGKALDRVSSKEPAVSLAKDLNDVAAQALPKPTTADTQKLDRVVDDSLSTNKVTQATGGKELDALRDRLSGTEQALTKLNAQFEARIAKTEKERDAALDKERARSDAAAVKANQFDEANSLVGSAKLFVRNAWKLLVLVGVLSLIGLGIWKGGKLAAAVYCPPVALGMNVVGGLATKEVTKGFAQLVKGGEVFKDLLSKSQLTTEVKTAVEHLFAQAHTSSQDDNIQTAVKTLTAIK
jgi:hypothetical protein